MAFYTGRLDFQLEQQFGPAMAIVVRDDLRLWLAGPTASALRPMPDGAQSAPGGGGRSVLTVDDLAGLAARLEADGVILRNAIVEGPGGGQILCADPAGNVVELFDPRATKRNRSGCDGFLKCDKARRTRGPPHPDAQSEDGALGARLCAGFNCQVLRVAGGQQRQGP